MNRCMVIDIDGTIADNTHRQHHLETKEKNYDSFYAESGLDRPLANNIRNILDDYHMNKVKYGFLEIIFLTGRPEKIRGITQVWLETYFSSQLKYHLVMRPNEDWDKSVKFKQRALSLILKDRAVVYYADDLLDCCKMAKELLPDNSKIVHII